VSRYKFGRSREFITGYKVGGGHWRSVAVQVVSEPEIRQGVGFKLRADERVRVQRQLRNCLRYRSKSKKCDKQLTFIVRVSGRFYYSAAAPIKIDFTFLFSNLKMIPPYTEPATISVSEDHLLSTKSWYNDSTVL